MGKNSKAVYKGDTAKTSQQLYNEFMTCATALGQARRDEIRAQENQAKLEARLGELEEAHQRRSLIEAEEQKKKAAEEAKKKAKEDAEKKALEGGIAAATEQVLAEGSGTPTSVTPAEPKVGNDAEPV